MRHYKSGVKSTDHYNTPLEAWEDILQFVPKTTTLWLPFYNDGSAKDLLDSIGYDTVHRDEDFFHSDYKHLVIDNPPYSIKKRILQKLACRGRPFALLLPMDVLQTKYIRQYAGFMQIVIPNQRYNFVKNSSNVPFKSAWFCFRMSNWLKTNEQLIFLWDYTFIYCLYDDGVP